MNLYMIYIYEDNEDQTKVGFGLKILEFIWSHFGCLRGQTDEN